jgi:indolepyruvate ferredoxin oxidoreductase
MLAAAGVRLYKVGLSFPLETAACATSPGPRRDPGDRGERPGGRAAAARAVLQRAGRARPVLLGKHDAEGRPCRRSASCALAPDRAGGRLAVPHSRPRHLDHRRHVVDFVPAPLLSNSADASSAALFLLRLPAQHQHRGARGLERAAGIGCHFMASWMERTAGLIQMGGEAWTGSRTRCSPARRTCSRTSATAPTTIRATWRSARPSRRRHITYKILFNDAVAMTGGQPVDGDQRRRDRAPGRGEGARWWWCPTTSRSTTASARASRRHRVP